MIPPSLKTKKWEDRMEKTQKAKAIKKLQDELREEKQAEITRFVIYHVQLTCTDTHSCYPGERKLRLREERLLRSASDWRKTRPRCVTWP